MNLLEKPNLLSLIILLLIFVLAGGYGLITYTQRPETDHFHLVDDFDFPFNFEKPDQLVGLPSQLNEISGLAPWSETEVLGVQDEDGELFVINTVSGTITKEFRFGKDRDYEGVARQEDTLYVLEVDGDVHRFVLEDGKREYDAEKLETPFSYRNDLEGICYDSESQQLLMTPKAQELNPAEADQNRRGIYAYQPQTGELAPQPLYYIDEYEVGEAIYGKRSRYIIKPSGIAVDPLSGNVYVISSVGHIMLVINRESQLLHIELLPPKMFPQPEGITFNDAGDLFISSEGRGGEAKLATFTRRQTDQNDQLNE
ncbi:SdiA-regulated domain-containing protein [Lewinella sp. W8]|uniref:SdiA-regulated domain-containing protein n=1 Tax=Lewinella sp. W8 TaxID=2528208 RepID=UPI0015675E8D|nr:SdiA-regulated domain-containing protein [Lewinella sp. W8]